MADSAEFLPTLSVMLPAYEEADNLRMLLPRLSAALQSIGASFEILAVDTTHPHDSTPEVCAAYGARCIPRRGGDSYGAAIRTGIEDSLGTYVVIMDADGSHDPEFISALWAARNDADVIIASRYQAGGRTDNPPILVLFSRLLNAVFSLLVRLPARDVSNSFRLYNGERLRNLTLSSEHFDIQEEILARLLWEQIPPATVAEVPFHFRARYSGESKRSMLVFIAAFLKAMVRLRRLRRRLPARGRQGEQ